MYSRQTANSSFSTYQYNYNRAKMIIIMFSETDEAILHILKPGSLPECSRMSTTYCSRGQIIADTKRS